MSDKNGTSGSNGKPDVAALRAEIAQTRAELGETVQALAAKADVKARAKEQVEQTKQRVKAQAAEAGQKALDAVHLAGTKAKAAAGQAGDKARETVAQVQESDPAEQVRRRPIPIVAIAAGVAAVIGVILVIRGSRR
ncbi:DUF3618 domain-containing protein [Actinoplanes sp. NPDC049265]|uniref:DUF3618 domain-containing protein n=1 Tax=Actinoplanes sp. NPDC049265 TaxID=3363902 RepID=UPI00371BDFBC